MPVAQQSGHHRRVRQRRGDSLETPRVPRGWKWPSGRSLAVAGARRSAFGGTRSRPDQEFAIRERRHRHARRHRHQSPWRIQRHPVALSLRSSPRLLHQLGRQRHLSPLGIHHREQRHPRGVGIVITQAVHERMERTAARQIHQSPVAPERRRRVEAASGARDPRDFARDLSRRHGIEREHLTRAPVGHRLAFLEREIQTFTHRRRRHGHGRDVRRKPHRSRRRPEKEPPTSRRHVPHERHASIRIGRHDPRVRRRRDAARPRTVGRRPRHQGRAIDLLRGGGHTGARHGDRHDPPEQAHHRASLREEPSPRRRSPLAS